MCPALEPEMHWTLAELMLLGQRNKGQGDLPGGTVGRALPASAGDTGSVPGLGRAHTSQGNEAWAQAESSPHSPLEKAHPRTTVRTQRSQKKGKNRQGEEGVTLPGGHAGEGEAVLGL